MALAGWAKSTWEPQGETGFVIYMTENEGKVKQLAAPRWTERGKLLRKANLSLMVSTVKYAAGYVAAGENRLSLCPSVCLIQCEAAEAVLQCMSVMTEQAEPAGCVMQPKA